MKSCKKDMFLATTGRDGFCSHYGDLVAENSPFRTVIIKGSSGSGKGTTIAMAAKEMLERGHSVELIHCASDPASLDGAVCRELGLAILDGTAPHVTEPFYPGAREQVFSVYDCLDPTVLGGRLRELQQLSGRAASLRRRAGRFVAGAAELLEELRAQAERALMRERFQSYLSGLCQRLFPRGRRGPGAYTSHRFACAVTPDGVVDYLPSIMQGCSTRILFIDRYSLSADMALRQLLKRAELAGYPATAFHDPIFPERLDGLLVEELGIAVAAEGPITDRTGAGRGAHLHRFYRAGALEGCANLSKFCRRSALSLLDEASSLMAAARESHMQLEEIYKSAMDYKLLKQKRSDLIKSLFI